MSEVTASPRAFRTCGVRVDAIGIDEAVERIVDDGRATRPLAVHLCNAWTLALTSRDASLAAVVDRGDLNLMDGTPLVWLARGLGFRHVRRRVYGPDLMLAVLAAGREHGLRHHLIGGTPEVAAALPAALSERVPGVRISGSESPPYREPTDDDLDAMAERARAAGADVVWIGLGTPRQDRVVDRARDRFGVPLVAVGAAFDFHAGAKAQAPRWLRDTGLEWLYRLAREPRRLWRRYLVGIPVFLLGVARGVERVER